MDAKQRRKEITKILKGSDMPISASSLASQLSVSRQIIVGDVAILRASGANIMATPRGYQYQDTAENTFPYEGLIVCRHTPEQLQDELYTIVDYGGTVINVLIEHPLYGQLSGALNISSRYDVDLFLKQIWEEENAKPLSLLTNGIHLHQIGCKNQVVFERIKDILTEKGILFSASEE